jgi:hypothetical protein
MDDLPVLSWAADPNRSQGGPRHVYFPGHSPSLARSDRDRSALAEAVGQRVQYFAVERQGFELELAAQRSVAAATGLFGAVSSDQRVRPAVPQADPLRD